MRYFKRIAALFLAVFSVFLLCSCFKSEKTDDLPDPTDDFYVYDEANVLDPEIEEYIIGKNADLYNKCGGQIVVACVNTTGYVDIKDYALSLFNKWGVGSSVRNNGILILLSIGEDDYWVLQGEGLEDLIQSGTVKLMLDEYLEPYFASKRYGEGVRALFDAFISEYEQIYSISTVQLPADAIESYVPETSDLSAESEPLSLWRIISIISLVIVGFTVAVIVLIVIISIVITLFIIIASAFSAGSGTPFRGHINVNPHSFRPTGTFHTGGFRFGGYTGGSHHGGGFHGGGFHGGGFTGGSHGGGFSGGSHGGGFSGGSHHSGGGGFSRGGGAGRR